MPKTDVQIALDLYKGVRDNVIDISTQDLADLVEVVKELMSYAYEDGSLDTNEWIADNPGPSGIWTDPPRNPYRED